MLYEYFLIFLLAGIYPAIVKLHTFQNPVNDYFWAYSPYPVNDFFLYYKMLFLTAVAIIMLFLILKKVIKKDIPLPPPYICVVFTMLYGFAVILSTLLSVHRSSSLFGFPGLNETVFVELSYIVIFYFVYFGARRAKNMYRIAGAMCVGSLIPVFICVLQALGIDIYRLIYEGQGFSFTFGRGTVYGGFFNPDYVGAYMLLILPMAAALLFILRKYSRPVSIVPLILMGGCVLSIIKAGAVTSCIALIVVTALFVVLFNLKRCKTLKNRVFIAVSPVIIVMICFLAFHGNIKSYVESLPMPRNDLRHIYTRDKGIEVHYRDRMFELSLMDEEIHMSEDGREVPLNSADHGQGFITLHPEDDELSVFRFQFIFLDDEKKIPALAMTYEGLEYIFTNKSGAFSGYCYTPLPGYYIVLDESLEGEVAKPLLKFSGVFDRGHIWIRTLPLLKYNIFYGSGPDTFAFVFPNYDIVDMYNNRVFNGGDYISKPHNIYLQIGVQSGLVSLICWLGLVFYIIVKNGMQYLDGSKNKENDCIRLAVVCGLTGYLITGICNDSSITSAPLYWAILGLGAGLLQRDVKPKVTDVVKKGNPG